MTSAQSPYAEHDQNPWLDNLTAPTYVTTRWLAESTKGPAA
jgi:hypothetical protein